MKQILFIFFTAFLSISVLPNSVKAQISIGYVLEIRGDWYLNNTIPLRQGQKLPASGVIGIKSPNRFDRIKIADLNGEIRMDEKCAKDCSFKLPAAPVKTSYLSAILSTIMSLIWSESSERYSAHRSRGGEISDGIVKLENDQMDLSPLLSSQGEKYLQWRKIPLKGAKEFGEWSKPIELKLGNGKMIISVKDLQPGLYEFNLLRRMENSFEPTDSAWILITPAKDYEKSVESFEQVKKLNKNLNDGIKPETAGLFIRAYLDNLARQK
ncbi:MAG TPA: hypothetical protein VK892_06140 [Pyrinomonadaceae bacterium]|nr:hypothetical protein [Pyrinomonadaceae bacterium]